MSEKIDLTRRRFFGLAVSAAVAAPVAVEVAQTIPLGLQKYHYAPPPMTAGYARQLSATPQ